MTRAAPPPDSVLLLGLLVDALGEHPHPEDGAGDPGLRAQWTAAGPEEQRRVLAAVAREAASHPAPEVPTPAGELARWLHARGRVRADPTPPAVPNSRAALGTALILLDLVRGGRDRPGHTRPTPHTEDHMGNAEKPTVAAARAEIARGGAEAPDSTQGHIADRHIRTHTPEPLYPETPITGDGDDDEDSNT